MFLKRIEMQGFKSFAEKTIINFESNFVGIVGPNGCGKSNITDAIRWVFGEQSAKNLRGSNMSDVVFNGAVGKRAVNCAEVTLVIDNSNHILNVDFNEVEITRKLFKNSNESEYYLNKSNCRLKDITDMILDTGLGKDSLSVISQGNVLDFAEAKPVERRAIFEEAAGVAKYKKRKIETLNKLERTQANIERVNDIVSELEKQVSPLKKQALKAQQYLEMKSRLTEIEVAVLVNDIKNINQDLETIEKQLTDNEYKEVTSKAQITILENNIDELKKEANSLDNEVNTLQEKLLTNYSEIQHLEKHKFEIDEKRKYIQETGTDKAKIEELKKQRDIAKLEYDDRLARYDENDANKKLIHSRIDILSNDISTLQGDIEKKQSLLNYLGNRKSVLEAQLKAPFEHEAGVKAIMEAKNVLTGIYDVITNIFSVDDGYQQAISVALGNAVYHIVTKDQQSAVNAIKYLKKNKTGRATFLPLDIIEPRYIDDDKLFVCENTEGFLGIASDFVDCDKQFDDVVMALLGNILVVNNIQNGYELSNRLKQQYKIVTLDGDVINRGGSMSGGYNKQFESPLTVQSMLDEINSKLSHEKAEYDALVDDFTKLKKERDAADEELVNIKIQLAKLEQLVAVKRSKYEELASEYEKISPDGDDIKDTYVDDLIVKLNEAYNLKDSIEINIKNKRARRLTCTTEYQRKEAQLRQLRNDLSNLVASNNAAIVEQTRLITNRENRIERLSREYQMTFEFASATEYNIDIDNAKEEVINLRNEINELGNVNLDAPASYEEVNERFEFNTSQLNDLNDAKTKLLQAITEMDDVMTKQFIDTFNAINTNLSEVFTVLFGGGKAKLVLEYPNDILNSGIDIDIAPPGKTVKNIRLFSGGEKSLIAICVLFSILKARPVPLCILDEVEASLDQGNNNRFAKYIHEFSKDSQFLVITHRPSTMAECDVLYGVTMPQTGVSKMIKVRLNDAINMTSGGK